MANTTTRVRARATIHNGIKGVAEVQIIKRGEEVDLDTAEAERLHQARLADIIGEPTVKIDEPPPLQNSPGRGKVAEIVSADGTPAPPATEA